MPILCVCFAYTSTMGSRERWVENAYQWIVLVCLKSHILHVLSAAAVKSVVSDALMASTWLLCPSTMCVQIKGEPTFICKSERECLKARSCLKMRCEISYLPTKVLNGTSRRRIKLTGTQSREHITILARKISPIDDRWCGRWNEFIFLAFIAFFLFVNEFFFWLAMCTIIVRLVFFGEAQAQKTAGKVTLKKEENKHQEIIFK